MTIMNGILPSRAPLEDRTNNAPTLGVIKPRDGDLVIWPKGATKATKAPYDLVLVRGIVVYKSLMGKAMETYKSNPPQNHLHQTTPLPIQWETMGDSKKRKFLSECFLQELVEAQCGFLRAAIQT
jgi:hypothetical protein